MRLTAFSTSIKLNKSILAEKPLKNQTENFGEKMKNNEKAILIIGIIFIAFNMRAPITAVGPVLELIKSEYSLSNSMAGLITTIPLLAFAVVSPFVAKINNYLGYGKALMLGLLLLVMGELIRSYIGLLGLFIGTAFIGVGIAIANVLLPTIIKLKFSENVGIMTSVYTTSMSIFASIGAGISYPLASDYGLGFQSTFALSIPFAIVAMLIWLPQLKTPQPITDIENKIISSGSIWKSKQAWGITLFMGLQSLTYYAMVAWLPTILQSKGISAGLAGVITTIFQLAAIPIGFFVPIIALKLKIQSPIAVITFVFYFIGTSLILFTENYIMITIGVVLYSFGTGSSLSYAISLFSIRTKSAQRAGELSGMAQTAGYLVAALGPLVIGIIYDILQSTEVVLGLLLAVSVGLLITGYTAGRDVYIED